MSKTMKTTLHQANSRGHANHGWLDSYHTFSFAGYHEPTRVHFGLLRVLNDDIVKGGMGFGQHPHDNMEIVSIPLRGALEHRDNTGGHAIIRSGEVQIMSAGSGIAHSEKNASSTEEVNFLQIWVFPKERNIKPRYDQRVFDSKDRINKLQTVVAPDQKDGALWINQDAWFSLADLTPGTSIDYPLHREDSGVYVFVLNGNVTAAEVSLSRRDGLGIQGTQKFSLKAESDAQLLLIEVPMNANHHEA